MNLFDGQTFWHRGDPLALSDIAATNCQFNQCFVRSNARGRSTFHNIMLRDASHWNCAVEGATLERITLHNLKRIGSAPLFLDACLFRNVKLSGKISGLKINLHGATLPKDQIHSWDETAARFYEDVDWALDISEAKFIGGATFEAIPGHLIRRNPETQALVRRISLHDVGWRTLDYQGSAIDIAISWFEQMSIFDSVVIVARGDPKHLRKDVAVLEMLRAAGIADAN